MFSTKGAKWFVLLLCVSLLLTLTSPVVFAQKPSATAINDHTFVVATNGDPDTLDPALAYDTVSGEVIQNVYETLVFYDSANPTAFVPQLAESYQLSLDEQTWTFHVRPGVVFHNGASLTPVDVAYSFQRGLLQGGYSSPQWLLAEPFFGVGVDDVSLLVDPSGALADDRAALQAYALLHPNEVRNACEQVKSAIVADEISGIITMHLAQPWGPFLATISQTWGSILDMDWTIAHGGWDGSCNTWQNWYGMHSAEDPLSAVANGTGPFMLDHWSPGVETVLARNNSYWRTPAQLEWVEILKIPDNSTRFSMLQTGNADTAVLSLTDRTLADLIVGEDCAWNSTISQYDCSVVDTTKRLRRYIGRPGLSQDEVLFNFAIPVSGNPYIGSGQLDGNGIPSDFFADVHIRKAFNYCFDWNAYGQNALGGEYVQATTLVLEGMPGYDLNAPHYTFNLNKCQEEFGLADLDHDGIPSSGDTNDVTQVGFHFQLLYNEGNTSRQVIAETLAANLAQIDPKFVGEVVGLPWETYLPAQRALQVPIMTGGWLEDIHDPHNWYEPYLVGTYAYRASIPAGLKAQFNDLIDQGVSVTDFAARHVIYQQLNQLIYDNAPFIILGGRTGHGFIQRIVHGEMLNPIFPGNYYYTIYKDSPVFADVQANYWAWQFIERLSDAGITGGCGGGNYCPDGNVTRAQMSVFLLVAKHGTGYVPPDATGTVFNDVPASNGFAKWIEQLAAEGITGGCGGGNYCPNAPVTREQMAVFLLVAKYGNTYTPPAATGVFSDVPVGNGYARWIEALAAEGITGGCGGGKFCPKTVVNRAQMAVFLVTAFNLP
jgi:peptide/nickel transport system substrate-binding protein